MNQQLELVPWMAEAERIASYGRDIKGDLMDEKMANRLFGAPELRINIDATLLAKSVGSAKWRRVSLGLWPIIKPDSELLGVWS